MVLEELFKMKKSILIIFAFVFLVGLASSVGQVSYCCERTTEGVWCDNGAEEKCDASYNIAPTSCEATSYCKLGCCYDSEEGTCSENVAERTCNENGGVWAEDAECEIPQCSLGCCLIGDQAAFVTQTRCKRLSALYGLEINFRTDLSSELMCIASATSDVKGACVFEKDFEKTCLMTTKKECNEMQATNENVSFHQGYLCSAETLGTNCGKSKDTTCVEGRDEVFYLDLCGNVANIYDSSKQDNENYWSKIYSKSNSCGSSVSNADSASCGNCDYYLGSTCKAYKGNQDNVRPRYGGNICRDLSCEYKGETYPHGATWCSNSDGSAENLPGSRNFRMVCYNGEVTVEPCADFRAEICIESEINGFSTAACVVNKWQDCIGHSNKKDCENLDKRDCTWDEDAAIRCTPRNPPGFNFWESESDADSICESATVQCTIYYEEGVLDDDPECVQDSFSGEACLCDKDEQAWRDSLNQVCTSLGDCGISVNYINQEGFNE